MEVEDEWDRDPEASDLDDLLFVTYSPERTSIDKLLETIREHGFEAEAVLPEVQVGRQAAGGPHGGGVHLLEAGALVFPKKLHEVGALEEVLHPDVGLRVHPSAVALVGCSVQSLAGSHILGQT